MYRENSFISPARPRNVWGLLTTNYARKKQQKEKTKKDVLVVIARKYSEDRVENLQ